MIGRKAKPEYIRQRMRQIAPSGIHTAIDACANSERPNQAVINIFELISFD